VPSTLWCIIEVLRNPVLVKHLKSELLRYYNPESGSYNIEAITNLPIVESIYAEIARLRTATRTIRTNEGGNLKLDDTWTLPRGMSAIMFSQDLGLNSEHWKKAQPHTVTHPLEEFWAERFLIADKSTSMRTSKRRKDDIATGTFSLSGLASLHLPFGDGLFSLAKICQAAILAVLLTEFDIQLCDLDDVEQVLPPLREVAYGTVKPLDKIAVRIRKRKPGEKSN
jgi:hypothetical protein